MTIRLLQSCSPAATPAIESELHSGATTDNSGVTTDSSRALTDSSFRTTDGGANDSLDEQGNKFLTQLHHAWSNRAPAVAYAKLRDDLLLQREQVDVRVTALSTVARIACPETLDFDSDWQELLMLASSIEEDGKKRKKVHREAQRLRNNLIVAALWSPQLLLHYGWDKVGQTQMYALRACAIRYPRFMDDVCPRLNSILLHRHCQGIQDGRTKTLNEATIQLGRDLALSALASATPVHSEIEPWLMNESGQFSVEPGGLWLSQLRPSHFRSYLLDKDCYGILTARDREFSRQTNLDTYSTPLSAPSARQPRSPSRQSEITPWTTYPIPTQSTFLFKLPPALGLDLHELSDWKSQTLDPVTDFQFDPFMGASPETGRISGNNLSELSESISLHNGWHLEHCNHSPLQIYQTSAVWTTSREGSPLHANIATPVMSQTSNTFSQGPQSETPLEIGMESESGLEPLSPKDVGMDDSTLEVPSPLVQSKIVSHRRPMLGKLNLRRTSAKRRKGQQSEHPITAPTLFPSPCPTMEGVLQRRHQDLLQSYAHTLFDEVRHVGASQHRKSRAQWFNLDTKWASIWTHSRGELPRGSAVSAAEADVHYYASAEFIAAARQGQIFHKPIVIKEKFMDSGMHTIDGVASLLQDAPSNAVIDIRKLDDFQSVSILVADFVTGIRSNRLEGANAVNLRNITNGHKPLFTMLTRFRFLQSLIGRAEDRSFGKSKTPTPADLTSCTSFSMLGLAGAFSEPHLDNMCGTWVRNLDGASLWMIIPQEAMNSEWDAFAISGSRWDPKGKQRLVFLEQDDVLLLPPGLRVVHAVCSPVDCLMEGGMLWDELNNIQIMEFVRWICKNPATTDKAIPSQLPSIIKELEVLVKEQPNRFRGNISKLTFLQVFNKVVSSLRDLGCDCSH